MRHPTDAQAWNDFDRLHPQFASESKYVGLGLVIDGFNPFGYMSLFYSM